jgi:hypothetical protein
MLGSGDYAARHGAQVSVVEVGRCSRVLPQAERAVHVCHRATWRAIDPIVVLAPATAWLGMAVPIVVLCAVTLSWRRTRRPAESHIRHSPAA